MEIYDENGPVATMGFSRYERYEGGDLPREEYYKAVYPNLRLGSFVNWGDYTPVRTEEGSESALPHSAGEPSWSHGRSSSDSSSRYSLLQR